MEDRIFFKYRPQGRDTVVYINLDQIVDVYVDSLELARVYQVNEEEETRIEGVENVTRLIGLLEEFAR